MGDRTPGLRDVFPRGVAEWGGGGDDEEGEGVQMCITT